MKKKRQCFIWYYGICLLFIVSISPVQAQVEAHFNQHWALQDYYNPAYAGQMDKLNITGVYSMQMTAFKHAPQSMHFGADMPVKFLKRKHGVGVGFMNDKLGMFSHQRIWAQYAFKYPIKKGCLSAGVQLGMATVGFDPDKLDFGEGAETDPAFPTSEQSGMGFDLGLGAYFWHPKFFVGVSAQHITSPTIEFSSKEGNGSMSKFSIDPMLYFLGGYNIQTANPLVSIKPSMLLQTDFQSVRADLSCRVLYKFNERVLGGGFTYSPCSSVAFHVEMLIHGFRLGYAYELYTSGVGASSGSHDIVLGYSIDINRFKKSKNKHKSIRIL